MIFFLFHLVTWYRCHSEYFSKFTKKDSSVYHHHLRQHWDRFVAAARWHFFIFIASALPTQTAVCRLLFFQWCPPPCWSSGSCPTPPCCCWSAGWSSWSSTCLTTTTWAANPRRCEPTTPWLRGGVDRAQNTNNGWGRRGCGVEFVWGFGGRPAPACHKQPQFSDDEHV